MTRQQRSWFGLLAMGLMLLPMAAGCTAAIARSRISDAQSAIADAEREGPAVKATYEYVSAVIYFEKARELEAYSRFGPAMEYGKLSAELAAKARSVVRGGPVRPASDVKATK